MLQKFASNRIHAALIHFLFSALIASTIILAAILIWYPDQLLQATGAKKVFLIILLVDVCLGPFLTLIIFNKNKPELSRDIITIFIIQIIALIYGMYTVGVARPVYITYAIDRFEVVHAPEINSKQLAQASKKKYKKLPLLSPQWVTSLRPTNPKEREALLFGNTENGADLAQLPKYYDDYSKSIDTIIKTAQPLERLKSRNKDKAETVNALLKKYPDTKKYGFIPLSARKQHLSVIIDLSTGYPVEMSLLQPW